MDATTTAPDRRTRLLDAALRIAGDRGLRAVTHRAVDDAAGIPRGSASNHFATKSQLVEAMVGRLAAVEEQRSSQLAHAIAMALASDDRESRMERLIAEIVGWIDTDPSFALAHYELVLAGARDESLRVKTSASAQVLWRMAEPIALAVGSSRPQRDGRIIVAVIDGLLLDRVTHNPPDDKLTADGVRHVLAGITTLEAPTPEHGHPG